MCYSLLCSGKVGCSNTRWRGIYLRHANGIQPERVLPFFHRNPLKVITAFLVSLTSLAVQLCAQEFTLENDRSTCTNRNSCYATLAIRKLLRNTWDVNFKRSISQSVMTWEKHCRGEAWDPGTQISEYRYIQMENERYSTLLHRYRCTMVYTHSSFIHLIV